MQYAKALLEAKERLLDGIAAVPGAHSRASAGARARAASVTRKQDCGC
jgi:hypothetical protein